MRRLTPLSARLRCSLLLSFLTLALVSGVARGQVFVVNADDSGYGKINEYAIDGSVIQSPLASSGSTSWTNLARSGRNLFVADLGSGFSNPATVREYTVDGTLVSGSLVSGLTYPSGLAVSEDGTRLFVADIAKGTIGEYDTATGAAINASLVTGLSNPQGIAISGSSLFVVNLGNGTIGKYTIDAGAGSVTSSTPSFITGLNGPQFIAVHGTELYITIGGESDGAVAEYTTEGSVVNATLVSALSFPTTLTVSGGNLFVVNNGAVGEYSLAGDPVNSSIASGLSQPGGIAVIGGFSGTTTPISLYAAEGDAGDEMNLHAATYSPVDTNQPNLNYSTGKVGQGFHMTGPVNVGGSNTGSYIDFGDWFAYESFTIAMWIKDGATANSPQVSNAGVFSQSDAMNTLDFALSYHNSGNQYQYAAADGGPPITFSTTPGTWQHLVITRDGASRVTKIYLSGQLAGTSTGTGDILVDPSFVTGLRFGADIGLSKYWKGDLDEIRFYDRAISPAEIAELSSANGVDVLVPGTANPYLAGMPSGAVADGTDFAGTQSGQVQQPSQFAALVQSPVQVRGLNLSGNAVLTFNAAGHSSYGGGTPTDLTDGSQPGQRDGTNGISGFAANYNALVGVFLDDSQPDSSAAPSALDFLSGGVTGGLDYTTLSPALKQIFFIGDGLASDGTVQQITAPTGATRLVLGTTDGVGWYNNSGQFSVRVVSSAGLGGSQTQTLPPVTIALIGATTNGAILHFSANTGAGLAVRIQSSSTPGDEGSWTDLPDGNGAAMTETSAGNYSLNTTFYPPGPAVSFRAIAAKTDFADSISPAFGSFALTRAVLSISATASSTTDAAHGTVTHIGDDLTFTFTAINNGDAIAKSVKVVATVPTYIDSTTNLNKQFLATDITSISSGGVYVPAAGSTPAQIVWTSGDLDPTFLLSETFTIHITNKVRTLEDIGVGNDYTVYSPTFQPPYSATGYSSGAPNAATRIEGPISLTLVPNSTTVAPGGLLTYTFTLSNFTSAPVAKPVAVVIVPDFTRFDTKYPTGPKTSVAGVAYVGKAGAPDYQEAYCQGNLSPEVVISFPPLAARGDKKHHDTVTFAVTFQAQWVSPSEVPKIRTIDYGAAFFDSATFANPDTGKKTTETALFNAAYNGAGSTPETAGPVDFYNFITDTAHKIAVSRNDSGAVDVTLSGSIANRPKLALIKAVSNSVSDTLADAQGDSINTVHPGDRITFLLAAANTGASSAEDVFIEDSMPEHTTFVSAKLLVKDTGKDSSLITIKDPDGRHLRFEGLQLGSKETFGVEYTVQVASGTNAPASGTFIDSDACSIGSSSTPETPVGLYVGGPIKVVGQVVFSQPVIRTLVPRPGISAALNVTANTLTALYKKTPSALPLTNPTDLTSFVPGVERYYVHYENAGLVAANGVKLTFPLPPHTAFYRASFVTLAANKVPGALGNLPGKLKDTPASSSIIPPTGGFLSSGGTVTFTFNKLASGAKGDVMIEVIVTPDAIQANGSLVGDSTASVTIHDSTVPSPTISTFATNSTNLVVPAAHSSSVAFNPLLLDATYLLQAVPQVGVLKIMPQNVAPGASFDVTWVIFNHGNTQSPSLTFQCYQPENTTFVNATLPSSYNPQFVIDTPGQISGPGADLEVFFFDGLPPHTATAVTYTFTASGGNGSVITDDKSQVIVSYAGVVGTQPTATKITSNPATGLTHSIVGVPLLQTVVNSNDAILVDIGGGNAIAAGSASIVAQGGGNIVAQGGGNIVAQGGGNLINIGTGTAASLLSNQASIVAQGGGNLLAGAGSQIVAQGGGNIIAAGAGGIVAQGGGNIVAQGGGNIVAQGGGNIVAQGGGNIVAQGGGNFIVAGGGIVAQGGGNIVAQGGGNILASTAASAAAIQTAAGNILATGGGSFLPNQ